LFRVRETSWGFDDHGKAGRDLLFPGGKGLVFGPVIKSVVDLHRIVALKVIGQAFGTRSVGRIEQSLPVVVAPARGTYHYGTGHRAHSLKNTLIGPMM